MEEEKWTLQEHDWEFVKWRITWRYSGIYIIIFLLVVLLSKVW